MLTESQALETVHMCIYKANKSSTPREECSKDQILKNLGITDEDSIRSLQTTIAADPEVGVPRLQHYIDPNALATITGDTSIEDIAKQVAELAVGKLCSNPNNPHAQRYPYPAHCPQCGYPVR